MSLEKLIELIEIGHDIEFIYIHATKKFNISLTEKSLIHFSTGGDRTITRFTAPYMVPEAALFARPTVDPIAL
ncbi:hypothetical protein RA955_06490 [Geobacillus proteiniphilus]|uniref:Uncharacterized protein n=1 Tax=Geobacillus proteiniphilus TaxID=860353 RepID=A0ABY9MI97_9BACL|nr:MULTISPECIES: hypothetical protein [Geobacillus]WMJ17695.1 hypothetical protein RA955_06490 [Geobacillus proteiniphilus]